jgi:integrase
VIPAWSNWAVVWWRVAGKRRKARFKTYALATSFRGELLAAARKGEAFDVETGRPVAMGRPAKAMTWYELACAFVDMKWPRVAATTRRTHAEALTAVTTALLPTDKGRPNGQLLRSALCRWAFNTARRNDPTCSLEVRSALRWIQSHSPAATVLRRPDVLRRVLDSLTVRLDGSPASPSVTSRRRRILNTTIEYAVELELLDRNPTPALKWTPPRTVQAIDRRRVVNPIQARTLLEAVRGQQRSGPRLVAFFGCLYFAALRPEEAVGLVRQDLELPADGWGTLHVVRAKPYAGKEWTDSGNNRDERHLKQRARGEVRTVPCPPELTALLNEHIATFGLAPDGRLFQGERNATELPKLTINRAWRRCHGPLNLGT